MVVAQYDISPKRITNEEWYRVHAFYGCLYITCPYVYANLHRSLDNLVQPGELPADMHLLKLGYVTNYNVQYVERVFREYLKRNAFERGVREMPWTDEALQSSEMLGMLWDSLSRDIYRLRKHVHVRRDYFTDLGMLPMCDNYVLKGTQLWRLEDAPFLHSALPLPRRMEVTFL